MKRKLHGLFAKVALASSLLALVATSAPPEWHIEDEARQPFVFVSGQANRLVTAATVVYRTPRGTWPFSVSRDVRLPSADDVVVEQASTLDARTRLSTKTASQNAFEVECKEDQCEGSLELDLSIRWTSPLPPPGQAGTTALIDAGTAREPSAVTLRASFFGGSDKPLFGCDAKDSSNDLEHAPKQLGIDVTMLPFQAASDAGVVPGAPGSDAAVALPSPVGLDASVALPSLVGLDASLPR
ncbi:MAG: hypothetical protein RLZZ450_3836 [Pseudomonadota bacterium]|jgi:hypothetical protein